jgi:site-specific DNA-methyltransferase (adenine-specific)
MSNYRIANWRAHNANNLDAIKDLDDNSIDSIVTDPPYEIAFMGRNWDNSGQAYNEQLWRECLRVLKPGGHLIAFGATRTIHRTTSAIEASGFEIRDLISWLYFSGFPKSLDISKAIDKHFGAEREVIGSKPYSNQNISNGSYGKNIQRPRVNCNITAPSTQEAQQWSGFGTALKPAQEPAVLARKPIVQGTIAKQVLSTGTGALNIDGCRFGYGDECWVGPNTEQMGHHKKGNPFVTKSKFKGTSYNYSYEIGHIREDNANPLGRWPANIYQCAKPSRAERDAGLEHLDGDIKNVHPTVKPLKLMRWLCRLITPPNGTVLDPFAGSGTTLAAAILEGFDVIGFELTAEYMPIIEGRCKWAIEEYKRENAQLSMLDWMEASK